MDLGNRGANLIKQYEKLRLLAYKPTPVDVWTIGWGSTRGVKEGMVITVEEAHERFAEDTRYAIDGVRDVRVELTQSMFDALVSLVYNCGPGAINPVRSKMPVIGRALRGGDYYAAWAGFASWRKQKGKNLLGLARRRAKEMVLFLEDGIPGVG
jgi:lysozyme